MQMITHHGLAVAAVTVTSRSAFTVLGVGSGALASNAPRHGSQIKACYKIDATLPPLDQHRHHGHLPHRHDSEASSGTRSDRRVGWASKACKGLPGSRPGSPGPVPHR